MHRLTRRLLPMVIVTLAALLAPPFCHVATCAPPGREGAVPKPDAGVCPPCEAFNRLNTLVRDGEIPRPEAGKELFGLLPAIREYCRRNGGREYGAGDWVFPLKGYTVRAIDSGRTHGYEPRGYDYFDGNRHKAHPSLDIFIRDRDRDDRDDRTGAFVPVLSMTGGVVVALESAWQPGSGLRGGKYLWIYDPASDALIYYAHNRELLVGLGAIVTPGEPIALVGRTGLNAFRKRSPTHLHITLLKAGNGTLAPADPYPLLLRCRTM